MVNTFKGLMTQLDKREQPGSVPGMSPARGVTEGNGGSRLVLCLKEADAESPGQGQEARESTVRLGNTGTFVDRLAVGGGNEEMRQKEVISGIASLAICRQKAGTENVKQGVMWLNLQFR